MYNTSSLAKKQEEEKKATPLGYGDQMGKVAEFLGATIPSKLFGFVANAPGAGGVLSSGGQSTPPQPHALQQAQPQQATYSNEGRNYGFGGNTRLSPANQTSLPPPPPPEGTNSAIAAANPAGKVAKTRNADGTVSYSGNNVSGQVSFTDASGQPLSGSPNGAYTEGLMRGGGGAALASELGFGGAGRQPAVNGGSGGGMPLYNVGGTGYSTRENAMMAANIRDGIDPMTGLNGAPQVSIMENSGAKTQTAGQKYMDMAMNAPRTLTNLNPRQLSRIAETAARIDSVDQQGQADRSRLGMQAQELAQRQKEFGARLGIDQSRLQLDEARQQGDSALTQQRVLGETQKNQAATQLAAAQQSYLSAADGSKEQQSALKRLQALSGKFGSEPSEWDATRIRVGVDANGNPIEGIATMNKRTGEVVMPKGAGIPSAAPRLEVGKTYPRTLADGTTVNARFMGNGKWDEVK